MIASCGTPSRGFLADPGLTGCSLGRRPWSYASSHGTGRTGVLAVAAFAGERGRSTDCAATGVIRPVAEIEGSVDVPVDQLARSAERGVEGRREERGARCSS